MSKRPRTAPQPEKRGKIEKREKSVRRALSSSKFPAAKNTAAGKAQSTKPDAQELASVASRVDPEFPVVGFGASAGGLEAFTQVLSHLPMDTGMAFVLVQHLDPKRESMLAEILARSTPLPVEEVKHLTLVQPNHIYVVPRGVDMRIENRILHLSPYTATRHPHMAIDYFFRSLAVDLRNKAIGVILSGTGMDGTQGLKAIKAEGGISFAQDEKSAKHDGMLRSAIAGGSVDYILPPAQIAEELARLRTHPYVARPRTAQPEEIIPVPDDTLAQILRRIHIVTGVDLSQYKVNTIKRRILRRMMLGKVESLDEYLKRLQTDTLEVGALYEDMLINVTQFFRDPETFDALQSEIFPKIAGDGTTGGVRIWVPGCSTGEEVYSIAICLLEYLEDRQHQVRVHLFGTEISEQALDRARMGLYNESIAADVSPERLKKYFVQVDRGYQISKRIRDLCIFARQNLTKDPPFSKLDLISCRNVLIYLGPALQKKVLPIFHYALKPNGYLLLGSSETIGAYSDIFTLVDKKYRIFTRRTSSTRPRVEFSYGSTSPEARMGQETGARGGNLMVTPSDLQKEADRVVLSRYAPPGVIVNEDLEVIQFRGQTGPFLEPAPGPASYNLLKMAREGLLTELRSAVNRALTGDVAVRYEALRVRYNGHYKEFDLEVMPLRRPPHGGRFLLVLFRPTSKPDAKRIPEKADGRRTIGSDEIKTLRQELAATKESLQAIIEEQEASNEELRSANEEIQSSNEELQSTNEELETAKEELQSSNEELNTVNEELENRNSQLAQANDDLRNLLSSVHFPIVMVSSDLRIRRFTPQAEKVLSIIPTDVGRPISHIRPTVNLPNLEQLVTEVIETLRTHEAEVQDVNGRWYMLRIRPYRTEDNKIEGAVLVLVDIDQMKRSLDEVRYARDFNRSIIEMTRSSILVLDSELLTKMANPAFFELFHLTPGEVVGQNIYQIAGGQWKFPALPKLLKDLRADSGRLADLHVEHDFPRVGHKSLLLSARQFHDGDSKEMVLLSMDDVTDPNGAREARA